MTYDFVITPTAEANLDDILRFIALDNRGRRGNSLRA
jgi:plasmid stabilization system protein ParE